MQNFCIRLKSNHRIVLMISTSTSETYSGTGVAKQPRHSPSNMVTKSRKDNLPQQFRLHVTRWLQCRIKNYICTRY